MTREFGSLLQHASTESAGAQTARQRLVRSAVASVRLLNGDELMRTVIGLDTELLLPYIFDKFGGTQRVAEQVIKTHLEAGRLDGSIRAGDPAAQARVILLVVQSFVLSLRAATLDLDTETLLTEMSRHLDAALRP
jgi:hypothetical protein